jgi:hypothetical protein
VKKVFLARPDRWYPIDLPKMIGLSLCAVVCPAWRPKANAIRFFWWQSFGCGVCALVDFLAAYGAVVGSGNRYMHNRLVLG